MISGILSLIVIIFPLLVDAFTDTPAEKAIKNRRSFEKALIENDNAALSLDLSELLDSVRDSRETVGNT